MAECWDPQGPSNCPGADLTLRDRGGWAGCGGDLSLPSRVRVRPSPRKNPEAAGLSENDLCWECENLFTSPHVHWAGGGPRIHLSGGATSAQGC